MDKPNFASFDDLKRVEVPGMTRQLFYGDDIMIVKNDIPAHSLLAEHSHVHEQLFYVLEGECDVVLGGAEKQHMAPGGVAWFPSNVPHEITVTSDTNLVAFDIFNPIREDFLPAFE